MLLPLLRSAAGDLDHGDFAHGLLNCRVEIDFSSSNFTHERLNGSQTPVSLNHHVLARSRETYDDHSIDPQIAHLLDALFQLINLEPILEHSRNGGLLDPFVRDLVLRYYLVNSYVRVPGVVRVEAQFVQGQIHIQKINGHIHASLAPASSIIGAASALSMSA